MPFRLFARLRSLLTVASYRAAELTNALNIPHSVIGRRIGFVITISLLVAASTAADEWLVPADLGVVDDLLRAPPRDVSLLVLQVAGVAAAGILAIVLSISLLVLNNASTRLGDSLVRFLMDEPVGGYVFDLLAATVIVSLWGLLAVSPGDTSPVFTPTLAALLLTLGVFSLLEYRSHALGFLNPDNSAREIARRLIGSIGRVSHRSHGEVVVYHLQRRSAEWLGNLDDLAIALVGSQDERAMQNLCVVVKRLFLFYLPQRLQVLPTSRWFPSRAVRMDEAEGWSFLQQRRMMREVGLGQPTRQISDTEWVERRLWSCFDRMRKYATTEQSDIVLPAVIIALRDVTATAVRWEHEEIVEHALGELTQLAQLVTDDNLLGWGGSVQDAYISIAEAHTEALESMGLPAETENLDWKHESEIRRLQLGSARQQIFLEMYEKLRIERAYSGQIVTPRTVIRAELEGELARLIEWHTSQLDGIATAIAESLKSSLSNKNAKAAGTWNLIQLVIARRAAAKGQADFAGRLAGQSLPIAGYIYGGVPDELKGETREAVEDILIGAIKDGNDAIMGVAFRSAVSILSAFNEDLSKEGKQDVSPTIRMLSLAAYVYLSAELDQSDERKNELRRTIERFNDPDAVMQFWVDLVQPSMTLQTGFIWQTTGRYHDLWLHFHRKIEALPRTMSDGPGIALREYADHPSEIIQRISGGYGWGLKEVVESMQEWFANV